MHLYLETNYCYYYYHYHLGIEIKQSCFKVIQCLDHLKLRSIRGTQIDEISGLTSYKNL